MKLIVKYLSELIAFLWYFYCVQCILCIINYFLCHHRRFGALGMGDVEMNRKITLYTYSSAPTAVILEQRCDVLCLRCVLVPPRYATVFYLYRSRQLIFRLSPARATLVASHPRSDDLHSVNDDVPIYSYINLFSRFFLRSDDVRRNNTSYYNNNTSAI